MNTLTTSERKRLMGRCVRHKFNAKRTARRVRPTPIGAGISFTGEWEGAKRVIISNTGRDAHLVNVTKFPLLTRSRRWVAQIQTVGLLIDGKFYGVQARRGLGLDAPKIRFFHGKNVKDMRVS